ncbi:hypothetical protein N7489_003530 [Penicillium chrysogenum]|uniref:IQ domain-containing protein n=1 Tax=Penicillium chrysogenum TaxID=5076 RepID=A0ABQ8W8U8_PENCH|nr:uncharacterized protein N7489_003530 [Penicillium chrysogenum]KAJ5253120.1 hypothetical protein N7489_003530 [Penicillium chrysogenum]KAJ5260350.1 hypothetical protein N7505_009731 [Penicillium chrysogenum]KAJ6141720.1 hypothetical protein N7497_010819 [Penicillium chrysogenum]
MTKIPETSTLSHDVIDKEQAAQTVQRIYRGYQARRELRGLSLAASTRWIEAFREAQWQQLHRPPEPRMSPSTDGFNQARRNWQRAISVARRVGGDDRVSEVSPSTGTRSEHNTEIESGTTAKMMDLQYFLEMVDLKHRHGSNLRLYHMYWRNSSSKENFFYWLDYGEGKKVELPQCSRDRLEKEQVRYLTREERLNYLVTVDETGLFRWAKNNEPVWTNTARFKDSLQGIVGIEDDVSQFRGNSTMPKPDSTWDLSLSTSTSARRSLHNVLSNQDPTHFADGECKAAKMTKKVVHASPAAAFKRLLGKSSEKEDMWVFVADTSFRLYIGIKKSGAFQHSSFLRGARIAAAGMIKIKHGQLRSLAPLSGHYRPPAANFRAFHHALQQQGVDMSHVSMSKSYIMLAGIGGYSKTKRKAHAVHEKVDTSKQMFHQSR